MKQRENEDDNFCVTTGSQVKCAFERGIFDSDNYACATAMLLQRIGLKYGKVELAGLQQYITLVHPGGRMLVISSRRGSGRIGGIWVVERERIREIAIDEANEFIRFYTRKRNG